MVAETDVVVKAPEVISIVESVFETTMSLQAVRSDEWWFPSPTRMTAAVLLAGEWNGAVLLQCDQEAACHLTGRFLSMDAPEAVDDDVRDVLGELANMIGGNLKCLLVRGIRLSIPSVVDGSDYNIRVCGAQLMERISFNCDEGPFWVSILSLPHGAQTEE